VGNDSHLVFRQKLLDEYRSVRRGVFMVEHPGPFSPKFGATPSHFFTQSPQNVAVERGIHSLACWDRCFALPQRLYSWRHQSGIFWIPPRRCILYMLVVGIITRKFTVILLALIAKYFSRYLTLVHARDCSM
jgi:hypothetical protein